MILLLKQWNVYLCKILRAHFRRNRSCIVRIGGLTCWIDISNTGRSNDRTNQLCPSLDYYYNHTVGMILQQSTGCRKNHQNTCKQRKHYKVMIFLDRGRQKKKMGLPFFIQHNTKLHPSLLYSIVKYFFMKITRYNIPFSHLSLCQPREKINK